MEVIDIYFMLKFLYLSLPIIHESCMVHYLKTVEDNLTASMQCTTRLMKSSQHMFVILFTNNVLCEKLDIFLF